MTDDKNPDPPKRPAPPRPGGAKPPVPPPAGMLRRDESPLMGYLRNRMELMERELYQARERSQASENALKQQDALRGEVESQLKKISEQIKQEKLVQRLEEDKSASRGRVDSLEKRLDEMHQSWSELLKQAIGKREADVSLAGVEAQAISDGLSDLRQEMARFKEELAGLPGMLPEIRSLREMIPAEAERRATEEKAVRENLRALVDRMGESLLARLTEIDTRLVRERDEHQERLAVMNRERTSLQEAMEELHHNVRQETLKDRIALENQFNAKIQKLQESLGAVNEKQADAGDSLTNIQDVAKKLHDILTRPAKAKDQMILDLESEKRELMDALNERTERLREYTFERREVERSLGESLMDVSRQLETERAKDRQRLEQISSLEGKIQALQADAKLEADKLTQKEERYRKLADERDQIVQALTLEADKVQMQISERMASEERWEKKILEFQKLLNDEKDKRLQAEQANSDLRAQSQTLADHIARVLREKESTEKEFAQWHHEREELKAALMKKDDMVGMLSSTFKNILKKPE
ncbi:MAG: hypothetical protein ABIJ96_15115 [Elusimicrobiota bacterium]